MMLLMAAALANNPAPGFRHSRTWARNLECEHVPVAEGKKLYPGRIVTTESRTDDPNRTVLVCREKLVKAGVRKPYEEAILGSLRRVSDELSNAAASRPAVEDRTWLVESYNVGTSLGPKIGFATKNALMRRGMSVSDRGVMLSASDVAVITSMGPMDAYAVACRRYYDTGALSESDVLLGIVRVDARETTLHAGLCADGRWEWLQ